MKKQETRSRLSTLFKPKLGHFQVNVKGNYPRKIKYLVNSEKNLWSVLVVKRNAINIKIQDIETPTKTNIERKFYCYLKVFYFQKF